MPLDQTVLCLPAVAAGVQLLMSSQRGRALAAPGVPAIAAALLLGLMPADVCRADYYDAVRATCRIRTPSQVAGSGCVFEISQGLVYVLTAAHVVEGQRAVTCEFWFAGHQSTGLPARVLSADRNRDVAVLALDTAVFGDAPPAVVPLAEPDAVLRPGETIHSIGCAGGAWATAFEGHVLGYDPDGRTLRYLPPPAGGRSGSAIFDAGYERVVALLNARTADDTTGLAVPIQVVYQAFGAPDQRMRADETIRLAQCPGGICPVPGIQGGGNYDFDPRWPLPGVQRRQYRDGYSDGLRANPYPSLPPQPAPILPPVVVPPAPGPSIDIDGQVEIRRGKPEPLPDPEPKRFGWQWLALPLGGGALAIVVLMVTFLVAHAIHLAATARRFGRRKLAR